MGVSRTGAWRGWRAILAGGAVALALGGSPALARDVNQVEAGKKLAELHCSRCHAIGGSDNSLMEGAPPFRDLKLRYTVDDLAESLAEGIMTSHPQMPVFTFSPEEIDDLLAYLDSLE